MKPKIVIASNIMGMGGAERTVQTIATALQGGNFDCQVVCMEQGGSRVAALKEAGVPVIIGDGTVDSIAKHFSVGEIDVLHFHRSGHTEPLHTALVDALKPKKIMETNVFAFVDQQLGPRFDLQVYKSLMMLTQRVWGGSLPTIDNSLLRQRVIYNPVTVSQFEKNRLSPSERLARRSALGFGESDIVAGRIGRNDVVKWGDLILAALPRLIQENPNLRFVFQTAPDNRRKWLEKHGYLAKSVVVLDETTDEKELAALYQCLDIYVHPSRRGEAFGNTLNEAMVWELPIVVENTPHWDNGQLEQVLHNQTGLVVSSVGGMVAAVSSLAQNTELRLKLGKNGAKHVRESFGLRGVDQYILAYEQLLGLHTQEEVMARMYPTNSQVIEYISAYTKLAKLDTPHKKDFFSELRYMVQLGLWRMQDSAKARGFFS